MTEQRERDIRFARTHDAIRRAFEELVLEMEPAKITVKALTERAGINRKTFYLHHETIEALLEEYLNGIMDTFFAEFELTPEVPEDLDGHARRFFLFLTEQSPVVEKLICSPNSYDFGARIYREKMARYRVSGNPFGWMEPVEMELVLNFIRTTAFDFYRQWVHDGKAVAPERAADLLSELTCHGVERLAHQINGRSDIPAP